MRSCFFVLALALIAFSACKKTQRSPAPRTEMSKWEETYLYQAGMRIDSFNNPNGPNYSVVSGGNQNVFLYSLHRGHNNDIYDDEYTASLWFPVDSGATSFSYTDQQLVEKRCYYTGGGAWGGFGYTNISSGTIAGVKKADGSWNILIDVALPRNDEHTGRSRISHSGMYKLGRYFENQ